MIQAYLLGLSFLVKDAGRDPTYFTNHLLSYLAQDFIQSAVSIISLSMEGLLSVAKRELRFVIETSIKLCFVQQKAASGSTVAEKLDRFDGELSSQRISIKNNIDLHLLAAPVQADFNDEVGRLYGLTSGYVHLSPSQIRERIAAVDAGRAAGQDVAADVIQLNELTARTLAVSLALIFHSVPEWVAGDWLVESDGTTVLSYFTRSRFIAAMDSFFDYKAERKGQLDRIVATRASNIKF
ncbi:MAG: hypothetical protein ACT4O6_09790 [Reyranella sp.]